ncbi:type I-E CRISPR-associated protein Cas6/Cse3/CasE [Actinoalloteichus fjordicus]|uniref:CRISPR-associated protein Cas6/Cse3/CasE, subtype I-E/ECOLI n=1 Tax=Actinoalloteichus fjordicus TaxID=1612552 RepID=A0AAC9LDD8_9PSEU|nr:type I-E CRISPR-associated protein Cas6/Cse3/CasE [Actinoalloteichus fjordicus]APU15567.1 CRISPR-associated protein Cas6/Cse3/CasE, subtype I-E/ECOLI [Actinoalloteichus fjordicus]
MAWLVRLTLSPRSLPVTTGLLDGDQLHRTLMRLLPDDLGERPRERGGLLYRVEPGRAGVGLLAQTLVPPRLAALPAELAATARDRDLRPLLDSLRPGVRVRYRIVANATKRHGNSAVEAKRGKLKVLRGTEADLWWLRRATEAGLHPVQVVSSPVDDVLGARETRHGLTRFDGVGIVTDPDLLRTAVAEGIGRAKTYGCGLLSLGPAEAP